MCNAGNDRVLSLRPCSSRSLFFRHGTFATAFWILLMTADVYRLSLQATYLESAVHALLRVPTPFPRYILLAKSGIDFKACPATRVRVARVAFMSSLVCGFRVA
jgi:hypothetical protein